MPGYRTYNRTYKDPVYQRELRDLQHVLDPVYEHGVGFATPTSSSIKKSRAMTKYSTSPNRVSSSAVACMNRSPLEYPRESLVVVKDHYASPLSKRGSLPLVQCVEPTPFEPSLTE